jgi:hypothetical protein
MQGKSISEVLHAVWFDDRGSQGVIFEKLFNPIPFETLGLIMTIVSLESLFVLQEPVTTFNT